MTQEERSDYAKLRMESANKTFQAARLLSQNGFWNSALNRLYYSVYYAVNALLVCNEVYSHTHSGMRNQFSRLFIKTGMLDKKYGTLLTQLYDWRQKGDYDDFYVFEKDKVLPYFEPVKKFIEIIESRLTKI